MNITLQGTRPEMRFRVLEQSTLSIKLSDLEERTARNFSIAMEGYKDMMLSVIQFTGIVLSLKYGPKLCLIIKESTTSAPTRLKTLTVGTLGFRTGV